MKLLKYIANLGYGSRREVRFLFAAGRITRRDGEVLGESSVFTHDDVLVDGAPLDPPPGTVLMLHKPVGYVCATRDSSRVVYDLLPPRFGHRSPAMSPIGRLDRDTSGLLLMTDDGQVNHRVTSPRTHVAKTYDAHLATDLRGDEAELFASGTLMLESESEPLKPATLDVLGPRDVRLTLTEGRYHQVRRMFGAVGNHVETLHRSALGSLTLGDLPAGSWRILLPDEIAEFRR